jgi:metal-responsive CopG/Arc/MetJ family transcriptional regulator
MVTKIVGVALPEDLKKKIDEDRGDISRSKFILRIIEREYAGKKRVMQKQ